MRLMETVKDGRDSACCLLAPSLSVKYTSEAVPRHPRFGTCFHGSGVNQGETDGAAARGGR